MQMRAFLSVTAAWPVVFLIGCSTPGPHRRVDQALRAMAPAPASGAAMAAATRETRVVDVRASTARRALRADMPERGSETSRPNGSIARSARLASFAQDAAQGQPSERFGDESHDATPSGRLPLPGFWDTVRRDLREFPAAFWDDTKRVYTDRTNLLILGLSYGASLTVQATDVDDTVENSFTTHSTFEEDFREGVGFLGNPGTHFGVAGVFYLIGQQRQDERTYNVGTKLFRALALTGVSTLVGKAATWDDVPNGELGSFPSGHTSSTFALASVLHHEYGPWVGFPLYGLGALVGYARLEDQEHYFSDVIMGGMLGLVIGHTIARDGEPIEVFGGRIMPFADPASQSTGLAWVKGIE